jgi:amino-acid N-acetyltransferase
MRSHWGVADPAAVEGSETVVTLAFAETYRLLGNRIRIFASLPDEKLDGLSVKAEMDAIGKTQPSAPDDAQVTAVDATGPEMDLMLDWLRENGLPLSDLAEGEPRYFALHDGAGKAVAFGGLVGAGDDLMIRSVVTDPQERGQGAGTRLIQALSALAAKEGAKALWLLTNGGGAVFNAAGFRTKPPDAAPTWIAETAQFRSLCGPMADLMCKTLR